MLALKFDNFDIFDISQHRALHFKEFNIEF